MDLNRILVDTHLSRDSADVVAMRVAFLLDGEGAAYVPNVEPGYDALSFAVEHFGPALPQYDGRPVWEVKAEARYEALYHSRNGRELQPHTECYEFPGLPHRYQALVCRRPARCGGGQTTLADGVQWVASLPDNELRYLSTERFTFRAADGLRADGLDLAAVHAVLSRAGGPVLRWSSNCLVSGDERIHRIRRRLDAWFTENAIAVEHQHGSLLIWSNHRILHSRTAFSDTERLLCRLWLDGRQAS